MFQTPLVSHLLTADHEVHSVKASQSSQRHTRCTQKGSPDRSLVYRQQVRQNQVMHFGSHQVQLQTGWPCRVRLLWQPV